MALSNFMRPSLIHAQVNFLINHMEEEWRAPVEGIHHQGDYASLYFFCMQFDDHAIEMIEGALIEEEDSNEDRDANEVVQANEMDANFFSSDDEEEGATILDDLNRPEVESRDEVMDDNAWVWKSNNP